MIKSLLVLFSFLPILSFSQGYDFNEYERFNRLARFNETGGNLDLALTYYDSMLIKIDFYPFDYYNAFTVAWKLNKYEKGENYLTRGALKGLDISTWFGDEVEAFLTSERGLEYQKVKDSLLSVHYHSIDKFYYDTLLALVEIDQRYRDMSPEMIRNDSLNFEALIQLSKERGFPTFPSTGYGCNKAWLLLWHHRGSEYPNSEQWQRITPLINKEIENGMLSPTFFEMHEGSSEP